MPRRGRALLLLLVLAVAAWLRWPRLDEYPPGFYLDESALAYNAWLVSQAGIDQYGTRWPVFFRALDDYKEPLFVYSVAAWLRLTDLTVTQARVPAALWGLAGVLVAFALGREVLGRDTGGLWAALMTAVTPWHVHYSRWCEQALAMTVVHSAAAWLLLRAFRRRDRASALAAAVALAATLYAYSTARLLVPATLAVVAACAWRSALPRRVWGPALVAFALLVAPFAIAYAAHAASMSLRLRSMSLPPAEWLPAYLAHLSPGFLLGAGDANPRHGAGVGLLPPWSAGLFLLGAALAVRRRESAILACAAAVFFAPLLGAFTVDYPHATRAIACLPYVQVVGARGLLGVLDVLPPAARRAGAVLSMLVLLAGAGVFWHTYTTRYAATSAPAWRQGLLPALETAAALNGGELPVHAPTAHYADWLFASRTPPAQILAQRERLRGDPLRYDPQDTDGRYDFAAAGRRALAPGAGLWVLPLGSIDPARCAWRSATHCIAVLPAPP